MRSKKLRGLRRRRSEIERWIQNSMSIDLDSLTARQVYYQKIYVYPWANLFCDKQPPTGYRNQITSGLIDIYFNWRIELDKLKQPYYLKIWLYYPRFMNSQVVAAVGDKVDYYNSLFTPAGKSSRFPDENFLAAKDKINQLTWIPFVDEDTYFESEYNTPKEQYLTEADYHYDQRLIKRIRENHDRKEIIKTKTINDICYGKTRGLIWCGGDINA